MTMQSTCLFEKLFIAFVQKVASGFEVFRMGDYEQLLFMPLLETMNQEWTVRFIQDVSSDFDHEVRIYSDDVSVESGVMQFAKRQTIGNPGFTLGVRVGQYVRGVQELGVS